MALKYRVYERKLRVEPGRTETRQIAVQQSSGRMSLRNLAEEIADDTSLGVGDIYSVLIHFGKLAQRYLRMGYSVELGEDLGTLTPRITAMSIPVGEKYPVDAIKQVNARFRASNKLKSKLSQTRLERVERNDTCPVASASGD